MKISQNVINRVNWGVGESSEVHVRRAAMTEHPRISRLRVFHGLIKRGLGVPESGEMRPCPRYAGVATFCPDRSREFFICID